jgi:hypothetical protein
MPYVESHQIGRGSESAVFLGDTGERN